MPLYFAYGANLDRVAMAQRCPHSRALGPARLDQHRFIVMAEGYATVLPQAGGVVHGLLWNVAAQDFAALDAFEELDVGLYHRVDLLVTHERLEYKATVYRARCAVPGIAVPGYMESVLDAAQRCGLPTAYLDELRGWLAGP